MNSPTTKPLPFLLGQRLSELDTETHPEDRQRAVCGAPTESWWGAITRRAVLDRSAGADPPLRVALVCDAGLGKTTNLQWVEAHLGVSRGSSQLPVLIRLDTPGGLDLLEREYDAPGAILDYISSAISRSVGGHPPAAYRREVERLQAASRVTLLIDGLDHAFSRPGIPSVLDALLKSAGWRGCPVWVAGRPHAFDTSWELFGSPEWRFLRVEPLDPADIRTYLTLQAGGDWYHAIPSGGRGLLTVPRQLRLVAGLLQRAVDTARSKEREPLEAILELGLQTAADVYTLAYFEPGEYVDPKALVPGADDRTNRRGLIASGLVGAAERIGLRDGEKPGRGNYQARVRRVAALLGAIAFEMFCAKSHDGPPAPNTVGVTEVELPHFQEAVGRRLVTAGLGSRADYQNDFDLLMQMNTHALDFLLFREVGNKGIIWHDRTVQAFFAAYWAVNFATVGDRKQMERWVVGDEGERLSDFDEFWTFVAELPDAVVDRDTWHATLAPCYTPPQKVTGKHEWVQWHRRMIYLSFRHMRNRFPAVIDRWRESFEALSRASKSEQRIHREIEHGFRDIPAGVCPSAAGPRVKAVGERRVRAFQIHQYAVTNEMYETFDPEHRAMRWGELDEWGCFTRLKHALALRGKNLDDRCPVVNVTWYDSWCFAAWCGYRLPMELEWEYACRAGSTDLWCCGNDPRTLRDYAWFGESHSGSTHPVGGLKANMYGLYDMHGNVYEWCDTASPQSRVRVCRGGCWNDLPRDTRSAGRNKDEASGAYMTIGFRLAADQIANQQGE
ncbi:SUMF1/EgtB/PvdO family nonheme iron enzyme [Gemmata sp. G18]|uniref:SUMF1/EgtB/PvdO family nonheme iron enzyme n=1 Tax=Gemmata palustris TaxID=2822762 RepID=A0ABS5BX83_9BACT|nr:SUMF1/EgtB/PvdO family nonheme iron enzyme [Gemmata palustris]MBP3957860.1 SUMF1/EgtB/PvdO family nonheme iron enzyme [Gemmata palustris]